MQMSSQSKLFEILENFKTSSETFGLVNEAIENVVPKFPTLMQKSNIDFLQEQFPEKYWPQALHQRYFKLFNYLSALSFLRGLMYKKQIQTEKGVETQYWNDSMWKDWSKLARDNKMILQSDAKAKAFATAAFPAGYVIDVNDAISKFTNLYGNLSPKQKALIQTTVEKINSYLDNKPDLYTNLKVGNDKPTTWEAKSYIADLAKELEGTLGKNDGYDLNNPRRIQVKVRDKEAEPRYVTDSFVMPTLERLKTQLKKHKISIASNIAQPQDPDEEKKMLSGEETTLKIKQDEGLNQVSKQLYSLFYNGILRKEKAIKARKEAAGEKYNIKKNDVAKEAKKQLNKILQQYTGDNFKEYLKLLYPSLDVDSLQLPYQNTEIVKFRGGSLGIQNNAPAKVKKSRFTATKIVDGQKQSVPVTNTLLVQTQLHKPIELINKFDVKDLKLDTMITNLKSPADALGQLYFDPMLFERFRRRVEFAKANPTSPDTPAIVSLLKKYNLSPQSTPQDLINASKRYFYQKATKKEYYQGGNTSASFSLHPTRMSAEARFLHKGHQPNKFNNRVDAILNKGVLLNDKTMQTERTIDFMHRYINSFLQPNSSDKSPIKKLFLLRAKSIINGLIELKVLENLDDKSMFIDISTDPNKKDLYVNPSRLAYIIKLELLRYLRQDFFTGSRRKEGDFIVDLDKNSDDLACKQGERGWQAGYCLYGADIRVMQQKSEQSARAINAASIEVSDVEEELSQLKSLMNARAKVRAILDEFKIIFKVLLAMYKAEEIMLGKKEKAALLEAGAKLTRFVADNALADNQTFIANFYSEFTAIEQRLVASNPAAMQKVSMPQEILGKSGRIIQQKTFQRRLAAKVDAEGLASRLLQSTELSDDEMNYLVRHQYMEKIVAEPYRMKEIFNDITSKMSNVNKTKFLQFIGNFNNDIEQEMLQDNEELNLVRFFKKQILQPDFNKDDEAFIQNAANTAIQKVKNLNNDNILEIIALYLDNLYGDNKSKFNALQKQQYSRVAKELYHEINKRGLKSRLHVVLNPNIEILLHHLEKIK